MNDPAPNLPGIVGAQHDDLRAVLDGIMGAPTEIAIVAIDNALVVRHFNPTGGHFFAISPEHAIGRSVIDIHDELGVDNERFRHALGVAERDGEYRFEQRIATGEGLRHLDSRLMPLRGTSGELSGYLLLARDVTELVQAEDAQRKLIQAVEQSPVSIIITDTKGVIEYVNRRFSQVTGYSADEVLGQRMNFAKSGSTPRDTYEDMWGTILAGREWSGELLNRRKNGDLYWDYVRIMPVIGPDGSVTHFVSLQEDITRRRQDEETLRLWATVFENSGEGVMITDHENRIIHVNKAFTEISGYGAGEVIGKNPRMLGSGRHGDAFFEDMWNALTRTGHWQGEIWDRRKNGEVYPKWLGISAVRDPSGLPTHYVAIFSDISERKAAQDRIEHLAHHDPLTGLPNRVLLSDRFAQALAHADRTGARIAMLFLDLDRLKTINDSLGHAVGDKLLQTLVGRLLECVRETDTVSRQGGDEFVMLIADVPGPESVADIAQKILAHVGREFQVEGLTLTGSFSIGISLYPDDGEDFETLLRKADTAMYHAKEAGRNTYRFFTEQMNVNALERLLMQNSMRQGLERGEFLLHYQPQIDLASGSVVGVEALLRWNRPGVGLMAPDRFIPVAEESGQIIALGEWVLHEACRQAQAWQGAGLPPMRMAVNISALQLQRGNLLDTVAGALEASGLDPRMLELELTESILIQNVDRNLDTVRELKARGIEIAIDDFGTGYSSLAYLKRLAVDRIKIDRSFVRDISTDPEDAAIVRAVIQMAQSLQLVTLAEGVETREQLDFLRVAGCHEAQGYLFAHPLPADRIAAYLGAHSR